MKRTRAVRAGLFAIAASMVALVIANPQINIAYGSYYLNYLLKKYAGNEGLALAAYNAGEGKVDQWLGEGRAPDDPEEIPFPETRNYVVQVLEVRGRYRGEYRRELGL